MKPIVLASLGTREPMGQQVYEYEIAAALKRITPTSVVIESRTVTSLRSPVSANARLPLSVLDRLPHGIQRLAAQVAYGRAVGVHRMDLRLPPAAVEVVTVHDIAPLRFDDEGALPRSAGASLRQARAVICPSRFAADEVGRAFNVTPRVIPNGVPADAWGVQSLTSTQKASAGLPDRYIVHAGGATARKNLASLAAGWKDVSSRDSGLHLLLCGPTDPRRDDFFAGLPRVRLMAKVPRVCLLRLIASAVALVVPSTYEGFGLPALEAMACGTPVVAARSGSLPEVCGDAAVLVEPTREGLADGLVRLLERPDLTSRLKSLGKKRAAQFTWERAAHEHLEVYSQAFLDRT